MVVLRTLAGWGFFVSSKALGVWYASWTRGVSVWGASPKASKRVLRIEDPVIPPKSIPFLPLGAFTFLILNYAEVDDGG